MVNLISPVLPWISPKFTHDLNRKLSDATVEKQSRIEFETPRKVTILDQEEITTTVIRESSQKELLSLIMNKTIIEIRYEDYFILVF